MFLRGADHVHRILQGSPPAEPPFELSSTFKRVLDMRPARALGVKSPQALRVRADAIIGESV